MNATENRLLPWVVLAALLLMTAFATQYVWESSQLAERAAFDNAVQATRDAVQYRVDAYTDILTSASGLFAADDSVERHEFRAFVQHLNLRQRYPGIQGIGLSLRVPADRLPSTIREMQQEVPDFHIWPDGARPEYHAIVMLEPMDRRNRAAIGYDMFTNAVRRQAMERARDTGQAIASGRVTLVQEIDVRKQPGFLIYVPVYGSRTTPASVADRRADLYGFVYAPFRIADLLTGLFGKQKRTIGFDIYDERESPGTLMYSTDVMPAGARPQFDARATVNVPGRTWEVRFFSLRGGFGSTLFPVMTLAGGIAVSVLLFALLRVQWRARANAERTAEQLRISESELQHANRAKDDFLATLSHELRTPMTAIMGWSKLLATSELDEATWHAAIDAIQKSSRAQAQLIDDLLDVSRITSGKMRVEPRSIDIGPVVRAAVDAIVPAANAKGVHLDTDIPAVPVLVSGDAQRLQQVVWNLLTNAVKFTQRGGAVNVSVRSTSEEAEIAVRDTGLGIDPQFLPHVFERFRQADSSTSRAHAGLGLGLAIVRHLIELHGGDVSAESDGLGRGSTFRVKLPVLSMRTVTAEIEGSAHAPRGDRLRDVSVLVVDDEEEVRDYVGAVLRMSGADVRAAASASDAFALLGNFKPDVIISDIGMPGVDGYEFVQRLRNGGDGWRDVPVIALTAYARPEDRQRALRAGFRAFIAKPVEPLDLRTAVAEALDRR